MINMVSTRRGGFCEQVLLVDCDKCELRESAIAASAEATATLMFYGRKFVQEESPTRLANEKEFCKQMAPVEGEWPFARQS